MRTVFTNDMMLHVYVQQTQEHGRCNSMSFQNDKLYSYAARIGRIIHDNQGNKCLLITTTKYSVTTQQHKSAAISAFNNHGKVFVVPSLGDTVDHARNMAYLLEAYEKAKLTARRSSMEWRVNSLDYYSTPVNDYAEAFGFDTRVDIDKDAEAIRQHRRDREARLNNPNTAAGRARLARIAHAEARRKREEERSEVLRLQRIELSKIAIAEWKAGLRTSLHLPSEGHMPKVTLDDMIAKVRQISSEQPDRVYAATHDGQPSTACFYEPHLQIDGSVIRCIMGEMLHRCGFPDPKDESGGVCGWYIGHLLDCPEYGLELNPRIVDKRVQWLSIVQQCQDRGLRWSLCVKKADEEYPLN